MEFTSQNSIEFILTNEEDKEQPVMIGYIKNPIYIYNIGEIIKLNDIFPDKEYTYEVTDVKQFVYNHEFIADQKIVVYLAKKSTTSI